MSRDPSPKVRLPEIKKTQQDLSHSNSRTTVGGRGTLYETRPSYISKKIEDEDLFGDDVKGSILLSRINEEKGAEDESYPSPNTLETEFDDKKEAGITNIFKVDVLSSSKYKEHNKGPVYKEGQMIKHSIVGSVESYERYQKQLKRIKHENTMSFDRDTNKDNNSVSEVSAPTRTLKAAGSRSLDTSQSFGGGGLTNSLQANVAKRNSGDKKKESKKEVRVSRDELMKEIEKMKDRQDKFYEEVNDSYKNLPVGDQLHHTKEGRCLEKYNHAIQEWEDIIIKNNAKIKRDPSLSVAVRASEYRQKREMADAFDAIKSDFERYGSIYWYMTLRKIDGKPAPEGANYVSRDFPEAFSNTFMEKRNSSVEIIRKTDPFSNSRINFNSSSKSSFMSLGKSEREFLESRLYENDKLLSKIMPQITDDLSGLVVTGTNKLNAEAQSIVKSASKKDFVVPRTFFEKNTEEAGEEINIQKYDRFQIFRNGLAAIVK
jgi:uncharacterized protein YaaR (DUF327 family)